ncbi:MAG: tRNA 4-thiouridine(8) synthase ThiI, partial [Bacilli bacterium]|nr:tRNA 4-thiouridine(8) synthase ThiI [Bacilli bacterium]
MHEMILVRYGDLVLKGKNQRFFVRAVNKLLTDKLAGLPVELDFRHDRAYIDLKDYDVQTVIGRLKQVTGLHSFSLISKCRVDYDEIANTSIEMIDRKTQKKQTAFKVETKRADKTIPETSMQISKIISRKILVQLPYLSVDVNDPELTLNVEVRNDGAYIFVDQTMGLGGYPAPINGKAVVLLSGGIDSPVAAFAALRKGLGIECVHFESTPLTPIESVQKVIDIASVLAEFAPEQQIRLHLVPFREMHEELLKNVPESYLVTIMRRMM